MASQIPEPDMTPSKRTPPGPLTQRTTEFGAALVFSAAGAHFGLWWVPFLVGAAISVLRWRPRTVVLAVAAGAAAGWALQLWAMAWASLPVGATARSIAALAGLPPYAATAIAVTLLLAALQALTGAWLARAILPRRPLWQRPRRPAATQTATPADTAQDS
jgi:hypothetical protein